MRFLAADQAKARAFARAAGISQARDPGLPARADPVVLRADTRVTSHGFRGGTATSFQSVLQAGTAVLVDRLRHAACPVRLRKPAEAAGRRQGRRGAHGPVLGGYQPDQVVVIKPTIQMINNLVIVNIVNNTWIERKAGTDGDEDKRPDVPPPYTRTTSPT